MPGRRTVHLRTCQKPSKSVAKRTKDATWMGPKPEEMPFRQEQIRIHWRMHGVDPENNGVLLIPAGGPPLGPPLALPGYIRLPPLGGEPGVCVLFCSPS